MKKYILKTVFSLAVLLWVYPQPCKAQERSVKPLNKGWLFILADDYKNMPDSLWQEVTIPHTWNNRDIQSGEKVRYGTAWYKRSLTLRDGDEKKECFLKFDGAGQYAEVYVNGKYVGEHLGGYSAFLFNITRFLKYDTVNEILVKVNNELNNSYPKDNFLFGIYGGLYRDVSLITTGKIHIALSDCASPGIFVYQEKVNRDTAVLKIVTELKNETDRKRVITVKNRLVSHDGKTIAENKLQYQLFPGGIVPVTSYLQIKNPHLWNGKKDPYLYLLETSLWENGNLIDKTVQKTGIRFFYIDPEKGFVLNGKPYRLYGVCRHQEWQDKGNALLPAQQKRDMELIGEIGATSIRLAHYQQAQIIYSAADSMGILVWAEIPFVNGYKEGADGNALQQLEELIKQNFNHPSIFVWGVNNEVIKNNVVTKPVNLTVKLHNLAKTLDPGRYTVAASNLWWIYDHPIHYLTDLQAFNQYTGWYGGKPSELKNWIDNFHIKKPDIRFAVSEYGAGGNILQQTPDVSKTPKPTGQFFPEGYQTYYHEVTYSAIEKSPFIWASYVWNMFDFAVPEWNRGGIKGRNHKGLVTYDRKTKKDAFYWYKANWSNQPVLYITGRRNDTVADDKKVFSVYSNIGVPELFINGKSYGKMKQGINRVKYVSDEISLPEGKYKVEVKAGYKGKKYSDGYTFEMVK